MRVIRAASAPHGFNLGITQGAGPAGIAAHLHRMGSPLSVYATSCPCRQTNRCLSCSARPGRRSLGLDYSLMLNAFRAVPHPAHPFARLLIKLGISPDLVTIVGTLGVVLGALICFPQGWLWQGVVVVTIFVISDMVDGLMAKISGTSSNWGAFLDSALDRLGDAAVFGGILLYFVYREDSTLWAGIALAGLVFGQWTSYVKARAESLGFTCTGAWRPGDRL